MVTATLSGKIAAVGGERRFLIRDIGWDGYQALLEIFGDHGPRMAYAHGDVELMSPGLSRENHGRKLGRMVETVADEFEIPYRSAKSTTLKSREVDRGAEADESYYIASVGLLAGHREIDLELVPPPDLVIEVEITNSLLKKLDIYAKLRVPEIWRFDGEKLTVLLLNPEGAYTESTTSAAFPFLPMDEVARFLLDSDEGDEGRWFRAFRAWVRAVLIPLHRDPAGPADSPSKPSNPTSREVTRWPA